MVPSLCVLYVFIPYCPNFFSFFSSVGVVTEWYRWTKIFLVHTYILQHSIWSVLQDESFHTNVRKRYCDKGYFYFSLSFSCHGFGLWQTDGRNQSTSFHLPHNPGIALENFWPFHRSSALLFLTNLLVSFLGAEDLEKGETLFFATQCLTPIMFLFMFSYFCVCPVLTNPLKHKQRMQPFPRDRYANKVFGLYNV